MRMIGKAVFVFAVVLFFATSVSAQQYPKPTGYVNDFAKLLTHQQGASLNDELAAFEKKTTIEIADDLFNRAQRLAQREKTSLRELTERGLRLVLKESATRSRNWKWKPVLAGGEGLSEGFQEGGWSKLRDEIYRGRGA